MVGIKDTFKVGDKRIEWESVIKWMLDWAQKEEYEKKEARDSFVTSEKIIFTDIKSRERKINKELYAKLHHVASNCGLEKECVLWKKSGKVLNDRIRAAKKKGNIGAYIDAFYQKDSNEWKNAYAAFDLKATEQKEKLKKKTGKDETTVVKVLVDVKPGETKQEYDRRYREAKQEQGCVLGDACKCKGLANELMMRAPSGAGYIHAKCLDRTCAKCKERGTAANICMELPKKPGAFVHRECLERTCAECKRTGTAANICMELPKKPGAFVHRECLERTCAECKERGTAANICMELPKKPGAFVHRECLERTCAECKETGTAKEICMVSPKKPGEFVHKKCVKRTCAECKETGTAENICMVSPKKPGEFLHAKCVKRTCSFCGKKADARTIYKNRRCSTPGNPVFSCTSEACRFQFPFKDPNGCAFCGSKFTGSVISVDSMKQICARNKMKIKPKPKRDACSGCFWRRFDLDQTAKREEELKKALKKDMKELYKKLKELVPKMQKIINKK